MEEDSVWLFMKVMCIVAYVYIAAALVCCLPWLLRVRRPASKLAACREDTNILHADAVHADAVHAAHAESA